LLLVHAETAPDFPGIQNAIEEFHRNSTAVKGFSGPTMLYHWHMVARSASHFKSDRPAAAKLARNAAKLRRGAAEAEKRRFSPAAPPIGFRRRDLR